jgi:hypothetical protein
VAANLTNRIGQAGYAARGVVYLIIGGFALLAALGSGGRAKDSEGALQALLAAPLGSVLLALVALGLLCFAVWRVLQSVFDADGLGRSRKAVARRVGYGFSSLAFVGLALIAGKLVLGSGGGGRGDGDRSAQDWTATLLAEPFGQWLVAAVGLGFAIGGVAVGLRGWRGDVDRGLEVRPQTRGWLVPMGRFGFIARGVVFLLVGAFLALAALHADPREARGLGGALQALQQASYGWVPLAVTAVGLFAFGAFELVSAFYRRIEGPSMDEAAREVGRTARSAERAVRG